MRVLVADKFEKSGLEGLAAAGCHVVYEPDVEGEKLVAAIAAMAPDVLVVRSTKVTEAMLDAGPLSLVVRAGAGYNTIDVAAASRRGIAVSNCPGKNAVAVAELTLGLIFALDRRIPDQVADLRAGRWNKKEYGKARGLRGRTLGLVGLGPIGCEVAVRAAACGLDLVLWSRRSGGADRPLTPAEARELGLEAAAQSVKISWAPTPAALAARCDILSLHVALAPETRGLIGAEVLSQLKPGSFVVNAARAEVMDHQALEDAVKNRGLRVALDVFPGEPSGGTGEYAHALLALPGVYGTHHVGASTDEAQEAIAAEAVRIVRIYRETGKVPNVVNLARKSPASCCLVVRHRDRPGVLAHVFDHLRRAELNVQETENVVFDGAQAAVASINLDGRPGAAVLAAIREDHADVLDVRLVDL
jgi:D-3-phosphoglycerate dehydrogenase